MYKILYNYRKVSTPKKYTVGVSVISELIASIHNAWELSFSIDRGGRGNVRKDNLDTWDKYAKTEMAEAKQSNKTLEQD